MKNKRSPNLTLQQILEQHLTPLITEGRVNSYQTRVLNALSKCKTAHLGGHWQACDSCGDMSKHYNSCGNRHCPGCQGAKRERWLLEREHDLFDVPHHHVTFTVPRELRALFYINQSKLYNLLFKSMWDTLLSFSKDPQSRLEAEIGVISILHTWTQKLEYHPHLHCIVPDGGLTSHGWKTGTGKFLFLVKNLSNVFKGKFCDGLKVLYAKGELKNESRNEYDFDRYLTSLKSKKWVVHSKPGFKGKESVLEYLGRYTHKIAISNYRLISLKGGEVTFSYRDRRAGDVKKVTSLPVSKFLHRFAQHILPRGFVKVRHYGLFSTRTKQAKLAQVRKALSLPVVPKPDKHSLSEVLLETMGIDINECQSCKQGRLVITKILPNSRGSPNRFPMPQKGEVPDVNQASF